MARNPTVFLGMLKGEDTGIILHRTRIGKWKTMGHRYADRPKDVFDFKLYLNPEDLSPVSTSIGVDGILDLPLTCLMWKTLKKGMNFVDIGANVGYFSLLAAKLVGKDGSVVAFEPESYNFELLRKTLADNTAPQITALRQVVSDRVGMARLFKAGPSEPNAHSVLHDRGYGFEEVPSITLDSFWTAAGRPRWNLLKVHVVGEEPVVFRGALKVLTELKPAIATVYDPSEWDAEQPLLEQLLQLYEPFELVESPTLLRRIPANFFNRTTPFRLFLRPNMLGTGR